MSFTNSIGARRQATWVMLLILLVAFGLRVYHLDFQSFWTDEGRSFMRASLPLDQLAAATPVEHMPTYFAMLHWWTGLVGASDFALRFFSVLPSVLAIAIAYRFAMELGSRRAGLVAALLLATGGFQVWYAQEARMYTWLLAMSLLSTWLFWRLLNCGPRGRRCFLTFAGYVLATTATIYLHHFGFAVPLTQTIFALLWLAATRDRRAFLRWVGAGFVVLLLYLPSASRLIRMLNYSGWNQEIVPVDRIPLYFFTAYVAGETMPAPWRIWLPWLYLALIAAGAIAWMHANRLGGGLLVLSTVIPITAAWALARIQPQFHERYTMLAVGPLMLLAANGFFLFDPVAPGAGRRRPILTGAAALLAVLVVANDLALHQLYHNPDVQKADYRTAAARIKEEGLPGDVILAFTVSWEDTFLHYYDGDLPLYNILPLENATQEEAAALIADATAGARRAWVLEDRGGAQSDQSWLAQAGWPADTSNYNGLYLSLYGMPGLPQVELPVEAQFGPDLLLTGVTLAGGGGDEGTAFQAGEVVGVTTHWEMLKATKPFMFSLRLLDETGRSFVTTDYSPQGDAPVSDAWLPGAPQRDLHGILLSPDLPPGAYEIALTLYDPEMGAIMPVGDGSALQLAQIQVSPAALPPQPADLPIPARLQVRMGEELEVLGYGVEPDPARPEATETLYLWWRALSPPAQPYQVRAELIGSNGETIADSVQPLSRAPADTWGEGQVVGARYPLALDPAADSGPYQLRLTLTDPEGVAVGPPLEVGEISVKARPRTYTLPRAGRPLDMRLGDAIMLRGYALDAPVVAGDDLRLTLYWQANERITEPYKVFVHLVDDAGRTVAQADSIPTLAGDAAPTESWRKGEVIVDTHAVTVPAAGRYRVLTGLYDPVSGERLPVRDAAGQPVDNAAIFVTEVQATEPLSETPGGAN